MLNKKYSIAHNIEAFFVGYIFLALIALLFSPWMSWIMTIFILSLTTEYLKKNQRISLSIIFIFSASLMVSSRHFSLIDNDDFLTYYNNFANILEGDYSAFFFFGAGVEIGLPLFHYILGFVGGNVQPHIILFFYCITIFIMFYIWIEKYGLYFIKDKRKALVVAISLLLFSIMLSTLVVRQMYSSIFLIYAITVIGKSRFIFLLIAILFHVTAIPLFLLIKFIQKYKKKAIIVIFIGAIFVLIFFEPILLFMFQSSFTPDAISSKLFYTIRNLENSALNWGILVRILSLLSVFLLLNGGEQSKKWNEMVISFSIIALTMITFPNLSIRVALLIIGVLYGYLISIRVIESKYWRLLQIFVLFYIVYKWILIAAPSQHIIWSTLWGSFDIIGDYPLYYWL